MHMPMPMPMPMHMHMPTYRCVRAHALPAAPCSLHPSVSTGSPTPKSPKLAYTRLYSPILAYTRLYSPTLAYTRLHSPIRGSRA